MKDRAHYFAQDCFKERNNPERDRRIIEKLSCWHESEGRVAWNLLEKCAKCGEHMVYGNPNLSTPNGYFWLLDLCREKGIQPYIISFGIQNQKPVAFCDPDQYADTVDAYLTSRGM